jgi:3-hydroxyisobutyrate dehydrogenase
MTDANTRQTGVIGLGQMGRGIAANLDRAGLLAAAWDIDPAAFDRTKLSAAVANLAPRALGARCAIVLFVVPSSREIEACLDGADGLLAADARDQVLVDLTTSSPPDTARLVERARAAGRAYVDGGMTGGAAGADSGRLTLMLGGEPAVVARCRPILERIAAKIFHVGGSGAGHTLKLIHNMILHTGFLATCEGCRMAERAGLDLATVIDVLNAGNARSFVTEVRFPKHIVSKTFDGRSRVANLAKDLGMAADFARTLGAPALYGPLTAALLDRAVRTGRADDDFTRLYTIMDELIASHLADERPTS